MATANGAVERTHALDWGSIANSLNEQGNAILPGVLTPEECESLVGLYPAEAGFRSKVVMARHGFGRGEYKYFSYPLPEIIEHLRTSLYRKLAPIANAWNESMKIDVRYPSEHANFLERCHAAGQTRPTPLLLQYGPGDFNCLHQDLYGEHVFPIQVAFLLSQPGQDFTGGDFVLTEQRPRMQSRPEVVPLLLGDAVAFAVSHRPVKGTRSVYRVNMRHGVSRLRSGNRYTMGIIFHDASSDRSEPRMASEVQKEQRRREALRAAYRPQTVRMLFVGESPPASGRFFYKRDSGLYRALREAFHLVDPTIADDNFLTIFQRLGCYLLDACGRPVDRMQPAARRAACVAGEPLLSRRIRSFQPETIVTLVRSISGHVERAALRASWTGTIVTVPYPGRWIHHRKIFVRLLRPHLEALFESTACEG